MTDDDLDQLVARLHKGNSFSIEIAETITALRARVAELERERDEALAAMPHEQADIALSCAALRTALAERDRDIADLKHDIERHVAITSSQASRIAEALEFCEDREDIIDGEFGPLPNDFMHIATILKGRQA